MKTTLRLQPLFLLSVAMRAAIAPPAPLQEGRTIAPGPFQFTRDSLGKNYQAPDWFRNAKLGFMEFDNFWKAEKREPEEMIDLYGGGLRLPVPASVTSVKDAADWPARSVITRARTPRTSVTVTLTTGITLLSKFRHQPSFFAE